LPSTRITSLTLTQFRNHAEQHFASHARFIVLTGANGVGKTNVLEALSLFAPGRGLRGARLDEMARQGASTPLSSTSASASVAPALPWSVVIDLERAGGTRYRLGTGTSSQNPDRRALRVDGEKAALSKLPTWLTLLWLTPGMDGLFQAGASERRRFFDRLVLTLYPDHAGHVARYEQALSERLALLRQGRAEPVWLEALEQRIAEHGMAATAARVQTAAALTPLLENLPSAPFPQARIVIECALAQSLEHTSALQAEEALRLQLARARAQDALSGRTSVGPHRVDLMVIHKAKNQPAKQCSTGEQKALLISLILSQAALVVQQTGAPPILLLDEITAHIDTARTQALLAILTALDVQTWMTGTHPGLFTTLVEDTRFLDLV
jgi:DNA replication and repair protein RecF